MWETELQLIPEIVTMSPYVEKGINSQLSI
jgi:hypothetical protein